MKSIKTIICSILFLVPVIAYSQLSDSSSIVRMDSLASKVFRLGEVVVTASRLGETTDIITQKDMELRNLFDVPRAMGILPGVGLSVSGAINGTGYSVTDKKEK